MNYWITKLSSLNNTDEKKEPLFIVNQMVAEAAKEVGFKEINYVPFTNLQNNRSRRNNLIESMTAPVEDGDIVVIQLPLWIQFNFQNELIDRLKQKRDVKLIGLVNEVITYSDSKPYNSKSDFFLSQMDKFDLLITLNDKMSAMLKQDNVVKPMIPIIINDFLSQKRIHDVKYSKRLAYIIERPTFNFENMVDLKTPLTIYGQSLSNSSISNSVSFSSIDTFEELPYHLNGGFGLVNIPEVHDQKNKELNLSHKYAIPLSMSIFIAAGIPLVVLEDSPYAAWVSKNQIGLIVSSLANIDTSIEKMTEKDHQMMLEAVIRMQGAVASGVFTKRALLNAIRALELGYEDNIYKGNGETEA
jgi:hypothetical protein